MKSLRAAFITGCLVLVPVFATLQLIIWLINSVDGTIRAIFPSIMMLDIGGFGFFVAIILILLTGVFTQNYVGKWVVGIFDSGIRRVSIVGGLYGGIKKFLETIFQPGNDQFHSAVLVPFPQPGLRSIGFRTGKPDPKLLVGSSKTLVSVFVPCTPNPTSGFYLLVPEEDLIDVDLSVQEAFKIVISMGIVTSEDTHQ